MSEETTTEEKPKNKRGRGPSFHIDDGLFTTLWANHNREYSKKESQMDEEALFTAFQRFCTEVFLYHTDIQKAIKAGCPNVRINDVERFKDKLPSLFDPETGEMNQDPYSHQSAIYSFMYERVHRKAESMTPILKKYNPRVEEPIGMDYYNWKWSKERVLKDQASKFDF